VSPDVEVPLQRVVCFERPRRRLYDRGAASGGTVDRELLVLAAEAASFVHERELEILLQELAA